MTDKDLCIETEEIQTDGKDTYYCHRYEPTPYEVLDELFTFYTPEKTDVFVDYVYRCKLASSSLIRSWIPCFFQTGAFSCCLRSSVSVFS